MHVIDAARQTHRDNKSPQQLGSLLSRCKAGFIPNPSSAWGLTLKITATFAVAGFFAVSAFTTASAANRKVDIVNETGKTLTEFYASNTGTDDWEEDVLGSDILDVGEVFEIDIDDGTGACKFDFKAVFTDGTSHVRRAVDVCSISTFTHHR
jgi:hypothetical protein